MDDEPEQWSEPTEEQRAPTPDPAGGTPASGREPSEPPTGPLWAAPTATTPSPPGRSRARRVWIAVGATVAGLALVGGGFGAGVAFAGSSTPTAHGTHAARSAHAKGAKRQRTPAPPVPTAPAVPAAPVPTA